MKVKNQGVPQKQGDERKVANKRGSKEFETEKETRGGWLTLDIKDNYQHDIIDHEQFLE